MTTLVTFDVYGTPKPQGSKQAFNAANGFARLKESGGASFAAWRNAVAEAAHRQTALHGQLDGPLRLVVVFTFAMPPSTIRKAHRVAGWRWKTTEPDVDKLVRAIGDGITGGGLVRNDALFVDVQATKYEVIDAAIGAHIVIETLDQLRGNCATPARQLHQEALL